MLSRTSRSCALTKIRRSSRFVPLMANALRRLYSTIPKPLSPSSIPSSSSSNGPDAAYVSSAVSLLLSHRSKSRWSHLLSLSPPSDLSSATISSVLLHLRNKPHLALRFFSLCPHTPSALISAVHVSARGRLRHTSLSLLKTSIRNFPDENFLEILAKSYRTFDSAPFVFDLLTKAHLQLNQLDQAVEIVRVLATRGIRPSVSTANSLIRSVAMERGSEKCIEMYREIFNAGSGIRALSPNVQTFNTVLLQLYKEEKSDGIDWIMEEMKSFNCEANVFTHSILMAGFCDNGEVEKAWALLKEMKSKGVKPDLTVYNTLIKGYCQMGEMRKAEELIREMELGDIDPSGTTYEHLIKGYCKIKDLDSALLLYGDMKRTGFGMDASCLEELLDEMCERGRIKEGLGILRYEMRREGFCATRRSYDVLIQGFCEMGKLEDAVKLQAEMAGKGFEAGIRVYDAFIAAYRRIGDGAMVERLEAEMKLLGLNFEAKNA